MPDESIAGGFGSLPSFVTTVERVLGLLSARSKRACALVLTADVALSFVPAVMAYLTKDIIDLLFSQVHTPREMLGLTLQSPLVLAGLYLALLVFQNIGQTVLFSLNERLMETVANNLHLEILRRGIRIPDLNYFDNPEFYNHRAIVEKNAFYAPVAILRPATELCAVAGTITSMILLLWALHPLIPILILASAIPDFVAQQRTHRLTHEGVMETAESERLREYYRSVLTTHEYANEVRLFDLAPYFESKYQEATFRIASILSPIRREQLRLTAGSRFIVSVGTIVPYLWLVERALHNTASIGQMAMYITAILVIQQQLLRASQTLAGHQDLFSATRVLAAWIEMTSYDKKAPRIVPPPQCHAPSAGISMENVWFKYPGAEKFTLKGLSLTIPAGKSLAIVGPNGGGKSTLVKLMCRLYEPCSGRITHDGIDIALVPVAQLRRCMAVIFQDFLRYELTVSENIALSTRNDPGVRLSVQRASDSAEASEFVDHLPDRYDTSLGRQFFGGLELSGGQWQRIALARGFFRDAGILILDEPTAALDVDAEATLYSRFKQETAGTTTILISHRLSTVRMADQIAVVDDGRVV